LLKINISIWHDSILALDQAAAQRRRHAFWEKPAERVFPLAESVSRG
jgi:hypothetical protein